MSSNLISRSTVNAFTKSFLLQLVLDTYIGYLGSFLLYWKFSPDTYFNNGAWGVTSSGVVDYYSNYSYVTDSYGYGIYSLSGHEK